MAESHSRLLLELYAAAQECTPAEFNARALGQLKTVLHFDSAVVLNADADAGASQMAVQSMHLENQPADQLLAWNELESPDHVLMEALARRGTPITRGSADTFGRHADFMDYCRRFEIAHTFILIPQETRPGNYDLMSLWRAREQDGYTERDAAIGSAVLPHFFQAAQISRRLFAKQRQGGADSVEVLASASGCLHFAPDHAIALLQSEWRAWSPPFLPWELLDRLASDRLRRYIGRSIMVAAQPVGSLLHLRIVPRPSAPRLTGAEWQVARLAASGMSYKEIARELGNSPATVRNQLHSVYAKLGVANKTTLSAALQSLPAP